MEKPNREGILAQGMIVLLMDSPKERDLQALADKWGTFRQQMRKLKTESPERLLAEGFPGDPSFQRLWEEKYGK